MQEIVLFLGVGCCLRKDQLAVGCDSDHSIDPGIFQEFLFTVVLPIESKNEITVFVRCLNYLIASSFVRVMAGGGGVCECPL